MTPSLAGIYAAVATPFDDDGGLALGDLVSLLGHLAAQGCHGVLVAGTTGEGPSLSVAERRALFRAAVGADTGLRILAGTGAASLTDACELARAAFDAGVTGIVPIPPFFYADPPLEGLVHFYTTIITTAMPSDGWLMLYHNPFVSAPPVSLELIARLTDAFPEQVIGIKDSSGDPMHAQTLVSRWPGFQVLIGDDRLLTPAIGWGVAGAITALAGLFPALVRAAYDAAATGEPSGPAQERLNNAYQQLDGLPRISAIKWLLAAGRLISQAAVRPPLSPLTDEHIALIEQRFHLNAVG